MIKVEAIKDFTLGRFGELKNIKRKNEKNNEKGKLYIGDVFECPQDLAEYLNGKNEYGHVVIKIIEVVPEVLEQVKVVEPPKVVKEVTKPRKAKIKKNK